MAKQILTSTERQLLWALGEGALLEILANPRRFVGWRSDGGASGGHYSFTHHWERRKVVGIWFAPTMPIQWRTTGRETCGSFDCLRIRNNGTYRYCRGPEFHFVSHGGAAREVGRAHISYTKIYRWVEELGMDARERVLSAATYEHQHWEIRRLLGPRDYAVFSRSHYAPEPPSVNGQYLLFEELP